MLNRMFFAQNVSQNTHTGLGYGRLYNGFAASDSRLAPSGWHVPTLYDMNILSNTITYANGGYVLKETGYTHWDTPNYADNSSGFTLLGSGYIDTRGFISLKTLGMFCSSEYGSTSNYFIMAVNNGYGAGVMSWGMGESGRRQTGMPIRLIKDDLIDPLSITDLDGNVYTTIVVGTQVWLKQNWKCTKYNDGTVIPNITDLSSWNATTTGAVCAYNNDENNV